MRLKKIMSFVLAVAMLNSTSALYQSSPNYPQKVHASASIEDVDIILNNTLSAMAERVSEPSFGTNFGEWSVLCLARGGYYSTDDKYFTDYYDRIVETVNKTASEVNKNGALHEVKSTENSRLILALSSIGRDAQSVGDWNLITPYNDFGWIEKQGINGPVFALLALDTLNYQTEDSTIRQQCLDYILEHQLDDGGWALTGNKSDPDVTAMTLQSLARYTDDQQIAEAVEKGISCLSMLQTENGGYASWGTANSESIAQVITACTALGIDPNTDERFVKNGCSAVDAIFEFYNSDSMMFSHITGDGGNPMATDQATYALVAYKRFVDGRNSLYDMTDFSENNYQNTDVTASTESTTETTVTETVTTIPETDATHNNVPENNCNQETEVTQNTNPAPVTKKTVTSSIKVKSTTTTTSKKTSTVTTTTIATTTTAETTTTKAVTTTKIKDKNKTFKAVRLYNGDDVDIIKSSQMAVAVSVSGIKEGAELNYSDGNYKTNFFYNEEMSQKTETSVYIALVDSGIDMKNFAKADYYSVNEKASGDTVIFGDVNDDGIINAQDAMDILSIWTKKNEITDEKQILSLNVNCDGHISNLDASEISESFVSGEDFGVMEKIELLSEEDK